MHKSFEKWAYSSVQQLKISVDQNGSTLPLGLLNYHVQSKTSKFQFSKEAIQLNQEWSPYKLKLGSKIYIPQNLPNDFHGLSGLFNDSLPDGWGLRLMDRKFSELNIKPEFITPAFRLAFLGNRAMGALSYQPTVDNSSDKSLSIDLNKISKEMGALIQGNIQEVSQRIMLAGGSPQGARPKITLDISDDWKEAQTATDVPPEGYSSWLLKFASEQEEKEAPIIEQIYMDLANKMGLEVMPSKLLKLDHRWVFATKRFDREDGRKVFVHSLGGMLEKSHLEESHLDYGHIATILKTLKGGEKDLEEGFKRAIFNLVLSNRDDHVKNFAFIKRTDLWSLSPAYDLTYMEGFMGTHTLSYANSTKKDPTYKDLIKLGDAYGLSYVMVREHIEHGIEVALQFKTLSKDYDLNKDLSIWISERIKELSKKIKVPSTRKIITLK